jgi:hypothetical protein
MSKRKGAALNYTLEKKIKGVEKEEESYEEDEEDSDDNGYYNENEQSKTPGMNGYHNGENF